MGDGANDRGDPRAVNQREREHLYKYGCIVRVAHVPERSRGDDTHSGGIHHLDVPMLAEGADDPPADDVRADKESEADRRKDWIEGATQEDHLGGGAGEHRSVQQDHPAEVGFGDLRGALLYHFALMTLGDLQFVDPQKRDNDEEPKVCDYVQFHCSNKNSALKPGPKAAARACSPVFSGRFSSHS